MAVDPTTHTAYVTNGGDHTVSVLNTTTNTVSIVFGVDNPGRPGAVREARISPVGVAVDPTTHTAYIVNDDNNNPSVSVVRHDTSTQPTIDIITTVPVGNRPQGVAVDPTTHTAYVTNNDDHSVSVINTTTNKVTTTVPVGNGPYGVAVDPTTHTAYVANSGFNADGPNADGNSVSVINTDTNKVTTTLRVGNEPLGVAVDPTTHTAYVTNDKDQSVSVINTSTNNVTATLRVGNKPGGVAVDLTTHTAYVTNTDDHSVSVINTG